MTRPHGLRDMHAADVMVPKARIFSLTLSTPPAKALEEVLANRFTRVPVHHGDLDKVAGTIHLRDLVELDRRGTGDLVSIVKPVLRVPARTSLISLLNTMQKRSIHLCVVKNEFSQTLGLVTMEDVLEEMVGEIRDEFDAEELDVVTRLGNDRWEVDADTLVLDFNRRTGWTIEAEQGERIAGLMFNALGRTPKIGEATEIGDYLLAAETLKAGKLVRVSVTRGNTGMPVSTKKRERNTTSETRFTH